MSAGIVDLALTLLDDGVDGRPSPRGDEQEVAGGDLGVGTSTGSPLMPKVV